MPKKGDILRTTFENFRITSQLGGGGAGEVYLAEDTAGQAVAIKVLVPNPDTRKRKRFEREIRFCSENLHPNVIRILGHGIFVDASGERPFYVMPHYHGTLDDYLKGAPPDEDKLRVFCKILDGVEAAHMMGITHRDIKTKNILVDNDGARVAVADFGIASFQSERMQEEAALTRPGDRLANFEYAAPEQINPDGKATEATDIFALGLLIYRMFTGAIPRGANPRRISSIAPQLPYLDDIANAMIQDDPLSRPQSIAAVKQMLIQRGHDFASQQKLDALRSKVIPTSELSDPLVDNPIRITGHDWKNGELILTLSQAPSGPWTGVFRNMRSFGGVGRAEPMAVSFDDNQARLPAPEHVVEIAYNHARRWFEQANADYAEGQRRMLRESEDRQRRELKAAIQREEESKTARERVLAKLGPQPK